MALLFYKWLLLMATFLNVPADSENAKAEKGSGRNFQTSVTDPEFHPFYVSVTEINHNPTDKTLEIAAKIFTEDLEVALSKNYKTKVDLYTEKGKAQADKLIADYLSKSLVIYVDSKPVKLEILGFEREGEATWTYLEVKNVAVPKKIDLRNAILYDHFQDQINLVHVTVKGERKSGKVVYPEMTMSFEFP
ncbi:MAG: DUF6702 family protein [Flavitalea sp.]